MEFGIIEGIRKALVAKLTGLETFLTTNNFYKKDIEIKIEPIDVPFLFIYSIINDNSVIIAERHDKVVYEGKPINLEDALKIAKKEGKDTIKELTRIKYKDIVDSLDKLIKDENIIEKIKKGIELNMSLAHENLYSNKYFGIARNLPEQTLEEKMAKYAAAGVEARMGGSEIPAMSVAGSGNQGITTTNPLVVYATEKKIEEEKLYKAILLAWLTTIYATAFTRYISPVCGAGIKAGVGLAAGFGYLLGNGNYKTIENSIINHLASITGMICDGAKPGCALKVVTSVQTAYRSAYLASKGIRVKPIEGIVGNTVEETLSNLGKYVNEISKRANDIIVKIINDKLLKYGA